MHLVRSTMACIALLGLVACDPDSTREPADADADGSGVADAGDPGDAGDAVPDAPTPVVFDWCDGAPPDADCFAERRDPSSDGVELAVRIANRIVTERDPTELRWDWGEAVMLVGLVQTARVTGSEEYLDFVARYLDHHIDQGYTIETSDTSAPVALAVALVEAGRDEERYRAAIDDALDYYANRARRTPEGGISHLGSLALLQPQLWADSLFMFGNVMTGWGAFSDDVALLDAYVEQYGIFAGLMQDGVGFFRHAVYTEFEQDPGVYWARANGWVLAAGYDHASVRINRSERAPSIEEAAGRLAAAAIDAQDPASGLWWTVLNRPGETYLETSASALFAFGLARAWRYGLQGDDVLGTIEAAMQGVVDRIEFDENRQPVVTGISGPTGVGRFDYYARVAVEDDLSYGLGAVLLALTETSGLPITLAVPDPDDLPLPDGRASEFGPSEGFVARRAEYLAFCLDGTDPGEAGLYGQVCRVATGQGALDPTPFDDAIAQLAAREDTSDFRANALVRLLYLDDQTGALGETLRAEVEATMLRFKYWVDEPGDDGMAYWTENHQILFHTAELLMGQRLPTTVFANDGKTGAEHVAHALPRIRRWLDLRGRYGFSEWHSNVYFNEDIPALLNLVDFAADEEIRQGARMVLDIVAVDLATNMFQGTFATTAGRTYRSKFVGGSSDSTREFAYIALGLGEPRDADNFGATFLATSTYYPPPLIELLATAVAPAIEHRQRDSFDIEERLDAGVGLEGLDEVVIWAGLSAIVHPDIIDGSTAVFEQYGLWDGFLFGSLPESVLDLVRNLMGTPGLRDLAVQLAPLADGIALEGVDTYVFRTPHYQMAAAQDWKPGMWSAQTLMWRASIGPDVSVTANAPAVLGGLGNPDDVTIDDPWIGGWMPRVTAYRDLAVVQFYRPPHSPLVDTLASGEVVHAYFPVDLMDEWRHDEGWLFGRVGDAYVGLWSQGPMTQSATETFEWLVDGPDNVFVTVLGSLDDSGDFGSFTDALVAASPTLLPADGGGWSVQFSSPTQGLVEVDWAGPMRVDDQEVDLGPYDRWESAGITQERGSRVMDVALDDQTLRLDFRTLSRMLYER